MADVFVSYKAEDRRRVKPLVEALQAEGFSVWWDEQIGGGSAWRHAIETELNAAACVIVMWSNRSVGEDGAFVQDEATRAQQRHVYVPVLIDKVHLPLGFGETQALPLIGWRGSRADAKYQAVLAAVRSKVGEASPAAKPLARTSVDRRTVIAGGTVATVVAGAAGGWALFRSSSASASDSIAVLPFANLSGDPSQAYFSDGIAEELRSALGRIAGLKVVGRTSSEAVRSDDAQSAAKKLGVANILTGSVRQSPSTIRVSAELVDGRSGIDRWSQDYDRSPGDTIKIQTDIAQNVASSLSAALGRVAKAAVEIGSTHNPEAQRLFIQAGEIFKNSKAKDDLQRALQLLDSAIALDSRYADAFSRKSAVLTAYANNYANAQELAGYRAQSIQLARQALSIAPNLPRAHEALSRVYSSQLQIGPSLAELRRARQLAPSDPEVLASLANLTTWLGDSAGGLNLADQAIALDPLNADSHAVRIGTLFCARRYADAVSYAEDLQRRSPQLFTDKMTIGDALVLLGRLKEAQAYYNKAAPDYWHRLTGEAILALRAGDRAGALAKLARLRQNFGDAASTQLGEIYAQMGDMERAFAELERAYEIKDGGLLGLRVDPFLDPLRSDPRCADLLRKMGFPGA
jgi:serine/threonine-protein kinase